MRLSSLDSSVPTTIGTFLQDTASQRRQDSHRFVHAFLTATATATSAPGGGVPDQPSASDPVVLNVTVLEGAAAGQTPKFAS